MTLPLWLELSGQTNEAGSQCDQIVWEIMPQTIEKVVADIAPWFNLRLPSCGLGFEYQAHPSTLFQFTLKL